MYRFGPKIWRTKRPNDLCIMLVRSPPGPLTSLAQLLVQGLAQDPHEINFPDKTLYQTCFPSRWQVWGRGGLLARGRSYIWGIGREVHAPPQSPTPAPHVRTSRLLTVCRMCAGGRPCKIGDDKEARTQTSRQCVKMCTSDLRLIKARVLINFLPGAPGGPRGGRGSVTSILKRSLASFARNVFGPN
jgi:hypothetical protein